MLKSNHTNFPFNVVKGKIEFIQHLNGQFSEIKIKEVDNNYSNIYCQRIDLEDIEIDKEYYIILIENRFPKEFEFLQMNNDEIGKFTNHGSINQFFNQNKYITFGIIYSEDINDSFIRKHDDSYHTKYKGCAGCGVCKPHGIFYFKANVNFVDKLDCMETIENGDYVFLPVIFSEINKFVYIKYTLSEFEDHPSILKEYINYSKSLDPVAFNKPITFDSHLRILFTSENIFHDTNA